MPCQITSIISLHQPTTTTATTFFGRGDEKGTGIVPSDIQEAAPPAMDHLLYMDEMDRERLDAYLSLRGRSRR